MVPDDWISRGLFTLDRLMNLYRKSPMQPLRGLARRRAIQWILEHQEADGAWGGIQPPWVYSLIALHHAGLDEFSDALNKGFDGFDSFAIEDEDTCTVQACISPVWDTCLAQVALLESGVPPDDPRVQRSSLWLMDNQILAAGDWQVRAKDTPPGGWAFEFHNDKYPDIDDSSEVIIALALARLPEDADARRQEAIRRGVEWIEGMQSKSGGWAAFDKDNDRTYVAKIPFSDFGETLDPPSADVTAHILEMYGRLGYATDQPPVQRGYQYLLQEQEEDGPWFGRWGVNYVYGVGAALPALEAIGEDMSSPYVRRAVDWLLAHQNDDGGWGECCGSYVDESLRGVGASTASQTAWALLALIAGRRRRGRRLPPRDPVSIGHPAARRQLGRTLFHRHRLPRLPGGAAAQGNAQARRIRISGLGSARRVYDQLPSLSQLLAPAGAGPLRPGHRAAGRPGTTGAGAKPVRGRRPRPRPGPARRG